MTFQTYIPRGQRGDKNKAPKISLSKTSIVLNNASKNLLNNPTMLELAYDKFNIQKRGKFEATYNQGDCSLYVQLN